MVKVYSPHFHRLQGKVNYSKGRLGKVHFQMNRGNISMMITMKREPPGSEKQKEQRARFMAAALTYRDLTPQQRENLRLWGAMRNDLISGYDWWTKAKLTDITIQKVIDEEQLHDVNFLNPDLQLGGASFDYWAITQTEDAAVSLAYGIGDLTLEWEKLTSNYGKRAMAMDNLSTDKILIVGEGGLAYVKEGSELTPVNSTTLQNLIDCSAVDENTAYIIADENVIIKYKNGACSQMYNPPQDVYQSVYAISENEIILGANTGRGYIYNGAEWIDINPPCEMNVFGVWGTSLSDFWMADFFGNLCHYDGSSWDEHIQMGYSVHFRKMRGLASDDIYLLTFDGELYHYDGASWTMIHDFGEYTHDLRVYSDEDMYVLAESGRIFRLMNGSWETYGEPAPRNYECFALNTYGDIYRGGEDFFIDHARMNRHALMYGGSSATSAATLEMADYFMISIVSGAVIKYGCKMKRIDADHPLPEIVLYMAGIDDTVYTDTFTPQAAGDGWAEYSKEITAPATLRAIKMAAQAKKRNGYADHAYVDDFFIQVSGRYVVAKCEHPLLERTMITSEDGSIVYYDSSGVGG